MSQLRLSPFRRTLSFGLCLWTAWTVVSVSRDEPATTKVEKQTKVRIGRETTFFTEPLDEQGYLDVVAAIDQNWAKSTSREENGAIDFIRAIGGRADGKVLEFACGELGIVIPPADASFFRGPIAYGQSRGWDASVTRTVRDALSHYIDVPWSEKDQPDLAALIKDSEPSLKLVASAVNKTGWYVPRTSERDGLIGVPFYDAHEARTVARVLACRAMLRLKANHYEESWQNITLIRRLARKIGQGPSLVEALVAIGINTIGAHATNTWLRRVPEDYKNYRQKIETLLTLEPLPPMKGFMEFERLMVLEAASGVAKEGWDYMGRTAGTADSLPDKLLKQLTASRDMDMDIVLGQINEFFDRVEAVYSTDDPTVRQTKLEKLAGELRQRQEMATKTMGNPINIAKWTLLPKQGRREYSELMTNIFLVIMAPAITVADDALDRSQNDDDIVRLAMQVASFRQANGIYPESLDQLNLDAKKWNLFDRIAGKRFAYRRDGAGFLLYHFGFNGLDNGGPKERRPRVGADDFGLLLTK